jgi:hypothetical protein
MLPPGSSTSIVADHVPAAYVGVSFPRIRCLTSPLYPSVNTRAPTELAFSRFFVTPPRSSSKPGISTECRFVADTRMPPYVNCCPLSHRAVHAIPIFLSWPDFETVTVTGAPF